jgi:UDP-GlcNAc:undecaprenyl-phosphate GlcNAc-1-phosphate transferase
MVAAYCAIFLGSILLCTVLTRAVRDTALSRRWSSARYSHHIHVLDIPRVGGIAIFASLSMVVAVAALYFVFSASVTTLPLRQIAGAMVGGAIIFLLGLYDDFRGTNPYLKFGIQLLAASVVFTCNLRIKHLPLLFGNHTFGLIASWVGTTFFILLITNAFNLVDGLDGLAAGSALFSTLTVFGACLWNGRPFTALIALCLAGSILGFLRYNFNPATIFLGDCGSLFIGFTLSVLALLETEKAPAIIAVAIPVVSFGFPILDTCIAVLRRFIGGQPLFRADREHIHHKLLQRGLSQRQVVVLLYGVSALFGLCSTLILQPTGPAMGLTLFVLAIGIWLGVQHLRYPEFFELGKIFQRTVEQKQIIINNLALRRAAEQLSRTSTFADMCEILREAFESTGFAGFIVQYRYESSNDSWSDSDETNELRFHWQRSHGTSLVDDTPMWNLSLDISSGNVKRGTFTVYQTYNKGSLQIDVSLLINEFRLSLNSSLDRLSTNAKKSTTTAMMGTETPVSGI